MNDRARVRGEVRLMVIRTKSYMIVLVGDDRPDGIHAEKPQHFVRSVIKTS